MARKKVLEKDPFHFRLYLRKVASGALYYARFFETKSGTLVADRSTGEDDERLANAAAGKLLVQQH